MKLLFDQNLSPRLVQRLADIYPGSTHVHALEMDMAPDTEIWAYAKQHGFTIVSKDSDFFQRSTVLGHPPKVIWLRTGNCSAGAIASLLREHFIIIRYFIEEKDESLLMLSPR